MKNKKHKNKFSFFQLSQIERLIIAIILIIVAIILFLGLCDLAGVAGEFLALGLIILFGWASWSVPIVLIILGLLLINFEKNEDNFLERPLGIRCWGLILLVLSLAGLFHIYFVDNRLALEEYRGGGYVGHGLAYIIVKTFGFWASWVIFIGAFVIGIIIVFSGLIKKKEKMSEVLTRGAAESEKSKPDKWVKIKSIFTKKKLVVQPEKAIKPEGQTVEKTTKAAPQFTVSYKKLGQKIDLPLSLLEKISTKPNSGDVKANKLIIQKTLESFSISVEMGEIKVGPTVTQYTFRPADGVKLSQITSLNNDLALSLAAHPIRIEAPIPGQSLVGIEVPNREVAVVRLRELLENEVFVRRKSNLTISLGKDVAGDIWIADLGKMPHLLVAGATGSGKTIFLNSVIISLIYQNSPDDLNFILIDPKRVEFPPYNDLPHLLCPVITEVPKTVNALKWAISEMDRRFTVFKEAKKRDIIAYNETATEKMPYIVIVIDELADLMVVAAREIETCIIRLAQMARATGMHLIMATQRPSVDIITGLIKANITSRVAFSVASMTDSRTILDFSGAEKLLGRGDMLFVSPELSKPKRLQAPYISDTEIKTVVEYLRNIQKPVHRDEVSDFHSFQSEQGFTDLREDELLPEARKVVIEAGRASASLLQRRMRVGYARAARLLDLLEEEGTIGPADGARPREVYKKPEEEN